MTTSANGLFLNGGSAGSVDGGSGTCGPKAIRECKSCRPGLFLSLTSQNALGGSDPKNPSEDIGVTRYSTQAVTVEEKEDVHSRRDAFDHDAIRFIT